MNRLIKQIKHIINTNYYHSDIYGYKSIIGLNRHRHSDLRKLGIINNSTIHHNLNYKDLLEHEIKNNEGSLLTTKGSNTYAIDTGVFTGRSPKDKWIVKNIDSESVDNIWWGDVNQPITSDIFDNLYNKCIYHYNSLDEYYVFDGFCGSSKSSQKQIRFIHEMAWQQHFVTNMFIRPSYTELIDFEPDFTIINACSIKNTAWNEQGLHSDTAIAFNIEKKVGIIMGTWYGGENKKGIFSLMNYWLPLEGIMSMHCSANVDNNGNSALFFGLSGTGKTSLSADPNRLLIGDDEHGWGNDGIFNLEGGCYAKTKDLSEESEPIIYNSIKTNALLENVSYDSTNIPDFFNIDKTENGRVSYPIYHMNNWYKPQIADHPKTIIFLTCDAFGVLPPVAKLTHDQAMYHFLSGYTAKVAGTERGIIEPKATFSACFGEAFLTLHPTKYANLLKEKIIKHNSTVYLVNTGWTGGRYGEGRRISINDTRKCIDEILSGNILHSKFREDSIFQFDVPLEINGIDSLICNPRDTWNDKDKYDEQYIKLASMFIDNYKKFKFNEYTDYSQYGPIIPSKLICN